ncbi:hypothetical protein [Mycolicibacterium fortuitum]
MEVAAAWVAAGIALWVALAQTREKRQQLRREAIAELDVRATEWNVAAADILVGIMKYLNGSGSAREVEGPLLGALTTAAANLNRALRVAEMVCPHKQIHDELAAMQRTMHEFFGLINVDRPMTIEERRQLLKQAVAQGKPILDRMSDQSAAVVYVGMKRYSVRPWAPKRLLARKIEIRGRAENSPSPDLSRPIERPTAGG